MTVVFDLLYAQPLNGVKYHGGGEYIKSVFEAMINLYDGMHPLIVCYNKSDYLDEWILLIIEKKGILSRDVKNAEEIVSYVRELSISRNVRFFSGMIYPYANIEFGSNIETIGTCHGLRILEKPYDVSAVHYIQSIGDFKDCVKSVLFRKRTMQSAHQMYGSAIQRFRIVITDSQHSAYSIKLNYPEIVENKEIYVYYAPIKYAEPLREQERGKSGPYILMISANRWIKNGYRGVKAIDGLYQKGFLKGIKTRVYGDLPARIQNRLQRKDCFEFYGYVPTKELEEAYRDCELLFYPTLNEGFGLPPLEALKYGKTCVISNVCSLPEIYGDSVYYTNPYDILEMQNRVLQAIEKRILIDVCKKQVAEIRKRQEEDLLLLCRKILK